MDRGFRTGCYSVSKTESTNNNAVIPVSIKRAAQKIIQPGKGVEKGILNMVEMAFQFDGLAPGTVVRIQPEDLHTSLRLRSVHDINLPAVLELGRRLCLEMPVKLIIFGIQAEDPFTLGESLTAAACRQDCRNAIYLACFRISQGYGPGSITWSLQSQASRSNGSTGVPPKDRLLPMSALKSPYSSGA